MENSLNENKALKYAEKYGIIDYKVTDNIMIYYSSYVGEHTTYKCIVDLTTFHETRQAMKRYNKKHINNV